MLLELGFEPFSNWDSQITLETITLMLSFSFMPPKPSKMIANIHAQLEQIHECLDQSQSSQNSLTTILSELAEKVALLSPTTAQ